MKINNIISKHIKELRLICEVHHVESLYAFGSSVSDQFNADSSDIDFLVTMDIENPIERGEKLMSFWEQLEKLFKKNIDLLTPSSLKNPVLKNSIDKTKVLIYDKSGKKAFV